MRKDSDETKLAGRLRIVLPTGGRYDEDQPVVLYIKDELSGITFFEGEIDKAALMECLVGNRESPFTFELVGMERVGAKSEHKTEFVPKLPGTWSYADRHKEAAQACEPFCVDGWSPRYGDYGNPHQSKKMAGVDGYNVVFFRHVRSDGTPVL